LKNNPRRVAWLICNRSSVDTAVGFDQEVSFSNGLFLGALGGTVSMAAEEDGEGVGYALYGVGNGSGGYWYVQEVYTV